MQPPPWKVGQLARRTGLSVRTLHHYHAVGVLAPSHRTGSGHRLYTDRDLARLQQVLSLRQLGFSLEEVRDCLTRTDFSPADVIDRHVARLRKQISLQRRLCRRLESIAARLRSAGEVSAEEFLKTIEGTTMLDKYYTPEQQKQLEDRARRLGPEAIRQGEADWAQLLKETRAEMEKGTDPASPQVQALARRYQALIHAFTGGDPGIARAAGRMWQQESTIAGQDTKPWREMADYLCRALGASRDPS